MGSGIRPVAQRPNQPRPQVPIPAMGMDMQLPNQQQQQSGGLGMGPGQQQGGVGMGPGQNQIRASGNVLTQAGNQAPVVAASLATSVTPNQPMSQPQGSGAYQSIAEQVCVYLS